MPATRVFQSGNGKAVRLPKEFRFAEGEAVIKRVGDAVTLFSIHYTAAVFRAELDGLDADLQIERNQRRSLATEISKTDGLHARHGDVHLHGQ